MFPGLIESTKMMPINGTMPWRKYSRASKYNCDAKDINDSACSISVYSVHDTHLLSQGTSSNDSNLYLTAAAPPPLPLNLLITKLHIVFIRRHIKQAPR